MTDPSKQVVQEIIEVGKRLWQKGFVAANDGNISVKISENHLFITSGGVSKGFLEPHDAILVDMKGKPLAKSDKKASSELKMHLEIYKNRASINAVVHAHPPIATGFAAAGESLDNLFLPEAILALGKIAFTPYRTTGTQELAETIGEAAKKHNGILMQNHGVVTAGSDLWEAYYRMETLEHFATISFVTKILGRRSILEKEEIEKLEEMQHQLMKSAKNQDSNDDQKN